MDVANLIIQEQRLRFSAVPVSGTVLPGTGLTHWSCTFRAEDGSFVVPLSTEGDQQPDPAFVLELLAADMRDVGEGRDLAGLARAWGIDLDEAAERAEAHALLVESAQAVLGESALVSLASGTPHASAAVDEVLHSI